MYVQMFLFHTEILKLNAQSNRPKRRKNHVIKSALLVDDMALQALFVEDPGSATRRLLAKVQLQLRVGNQSQVEICKGYV